MTNRERNRSEIDSGGRGSTSSDRSSYSDQSRDREYYGKERNQSYRPDNDSDWNDQENWNSSEQFTGRGRFDEGQQGFQDSDQRDFSDRDFGRDDSPRSSSQRGYGQDEDSGFSQGKRREGGGRFLSSTDLSSSYQGHYGQPRFGGVGSFGFGTGTTSMRKSRAGSSGQTTSDRNLYDNSSESGGAAMTRPSYRGLGPKGFQRSDERIREMVSETLEDHHDIDASDIEVQVASGEVTLTGTVSNRSTKRLAEDVIEFLPGVRDVTNNLKVKRGMLGRVADSIQQALGVDDDETSRSASSRSGSSGRGTSRSKR